MNEAEELQRVQAMLTRGRLAVDTFDGKRATFLTHIGASPRLIPGPWIASRPLIAALTLASLTPPQRASLARAVIVEWGREFGVGRMVLAAHPSGLPLGGACLSLRPRSPGGEGRPHLLYTWALGPSAAPVSCDWLLLRAQPSWASARDMHPLSIRGLETLAQLGGKVLLLVSSPVAAREVANLVGTHLPLDSHARFAPYLDHHQRDAALLLWPHDALGAASLGRKDVSTAVLIAAPEAVMQQATRWAANRPGLELVEAPCPGQIKRGGLARYWKACGKPRVLLRGDPEWTAEGGPWLESLGARVSAHSEATQLDLF